MDNAHADYDDYCAVGFQLAVGEWISPILIHFSADEQHRCYAILLRADALAQ